MRREVASKLGSVIEYAIARGYRDKPNPAPSIVRQLPKRRIKNARALPVENVRDAVYRMDAVCQTIIYPLALPFQFLAGARLDHSNFRRAMQRAGIEATPHGGRTTLRRWIAHSGMYPGLRRNCP